MRRRWAALRGPPPPRFGFGGAVAAASRGVVRWLSLPVGGWGALPLVLAAVAGRPLAGKP